jgi:integrase
MYPPGQRRIQCSERISPVSRSAVGYLSRGERRRRATEIVEAAGVNNKQEFIEQTSGTTFREQAEWFLEHAANRKRRPVKQKTLICWESCIARWLNPNVGDVPLAQIHNATLKGLVEQLSNAGLSAKSINTYASLAKSIVASALDENGEAKFPRKWNNDFIDLPIVESQKQITFTAEIVNGILQRAHGNDLVLYALLAGTALRVGEAFGLEIKNLSPDCRTITVEESEHLSLKTKAAKRKVDLCAKLAALLKAYIGDRSSGLVFANRNGKRLSQTNVLRRWLHPILEELNAPKTGFHAFRRFRVSWLRKQRAPEHLIQYWVGHANKTITDLYDKATHDDEYRLDIAEKVGVNFVVPDPMIPMIPKKRRKKQTQVAA